MMLSHFRTVMVLFQHPKVLGTGKLFGYDMSQEEYGTWITVSTFKEFQGLEISKYVLLKLAKRPALPAIIARPLLSLIHI